MPAPSGREPFGVRMRLTSSLFEGAGWPSGQTEGVSQGDAELYRMSVTAQRVQGEEQGTGIVTAVRSDESIGTESATAAFPVSSASVLRISLHQRTLSCIE